MCIRFSQGSFEGFNSTLSFSASSGEPGIIDATIFFSQSSRESLTLEKLFSTNSNEKILTASEYEVQFPEVQGSYDIPAIDWDLWPDPDAAGYQPNPPAGSWPLRTKDSTIRTSHYIIPYPKVSASISGIDLTPYLKAYSISESRGGTGCSGTLVCKDRDGFLSNELTTLSLDAAELKPHNKTFARKVVLNVEHNGVKGKYPALIPSDPSWDEDGTVTINFTDGGEILDLDNQTLPNIVHEEGAKGRSNETLRALGILAGVTVQSKLPDYEIRSFRFNNQNVNYGMNQIMQIMQGYRVFHGEICNLEKLNPAKPQSWTFTDRLHIESLTYRLDTSGLRTFFRAFRNETQSSVIAAPLSCVGGECVGRVVNLYFDQPVNYAVVLHRSPNGKIIDGVFFGENDKVLNQEPSNVYSNILEKAYRWEATFKPSRYDNKPYVPQWNVFAIGGAPLSGDTEFSEELAASSVEAAFGRRPEYQDMDTDLILDNETITKMLQAVVEEVHWSVRKFNLSSPFLAPVRVGDFVKVEDKRFDVSERLLVNGWSHDWSVEGGFRGEYDLAGRI